MIENNFFKKNNQEEELIKKFDLRTTPLEYNESDAVNYSSRISESADLKENPNNLIRQTFKMLPENLKDKQVIDIGCGEGRWDRLMAERGAVVTGIDSSQKMTEIAAERSKKFNDKIELIRADISNLAGIDKKFDFAFSCYTFNNINNLNDIFQILNKILKKDGELLIATKLLNFDKSENKILKNYYLPIKSSRHSIYTYGNEFGDYEKISKSNNFELIDSYLKEVGGGFKNDELNSQNIKIFDAVLKYKKLPS